MSAMLDKVEQAVTEQLETDDRLREIFATHFHLSGTDAEKNPGYKAWALYAVEVAVSLSNMILSLRKPDQKRGFRSIMDLTFALNTNEFWTKNAAVLVPALTLVLNAHRDYVDMSMQRREMNEYAKYDTLMAAAKAIPLEIFPMVLYLVGGPALMAQESLNIKKALAPYFL